MNTAEIAGRFHARRVGRGKWMAHCSIHGRDRNRSLEIKEGKNPGTTIVGCYAGCDKGLVLAAAGLQLSDLFEGEMRHDPFWEAQRRDRDRLELLERQHGLSIMAQAVIPDERKYWAAVELRIAGDMRELRDRLFPEEKQRRDREREVQRIIREYSLEELWNCLPLNK